MPRKILPAILNATESGLPSDVLRERWPDGPHESPADVRPAGVSPIRLSVARDRVVVEVDGITTVDTTGLHVPSAAGVSTGR